ncbi:50S ribosomal protein L10, partial [Candidatus Micrarchaeota archaeon]|nr:50S ribosomal protein L10 [Candidatus Micrarchaeota archaeon]
MTGHTRPWKEAQLKELKDLSEKYNVIAVADLAMFPASLFQDVRKRLQGRAIVKVSKTRLIQRAFAETAGKEILKDYANKSCGIIFTEMNPFEIYAFLKKHKGNMSAKEGMIAENDITIPAGDTGLPPGPALSDLKAVGLQIQVQGATIHITKDKVVVKAGEVVSPVVAATLQKLDIKPVKIGLNLIAALENGQVFKPDVLNIDNDEVYANFKNAYTSALNLAFFARYPTAETTPMLIAKAFREAKAVALAGEVFTKETMPALLAKADAQAKALKAKVPEEAPAETPAEEKSAEGEEKKEDAPAEEKTEEK